MLIFKELKFAFFPCRENNFKPLALQRQFLTYYVMIFLALKLVIFPFYLLFPQTSFFAEIIGSNLIELANQDRQAAGLMPLKENAVLSQAALAKANDMISNGYFNHTSPSGITPWFWFKQNNYYYRAAGENLAIGFLDSVEVERAWKESPSHRQNLLNPAFKEIGIAVIKGNFQGKETTIVVQFFGNPVQKTTPLLIATKPKSSSVLPVPVSSSPEPKEAIEFLEPEFIGPESLAKEKIEIPNQVLSFGVNKYDRFASKTVNFLLLFLIGSLLFNFLVNLIEGIKKPELALDAAFLVLLFFGANLIDKQLIVGLIPHNFGI